MIMVTGGTGMVGAHLLFALAKKNLPTLALFRTKKRQQKVEDFFKLLTPNYKKYYDLIQWKEADINDLVELEEAITKATIIYHCAAKVSYAQYHAEKLIKTNIEGTANIVNLALKYNVKKFIFVSSIASLGVESTVSFVNEEYLWNSNKLHTPYAYSKYGAELEVWRGSQEGLDVVIVNPGIILGSHFWERSSGRLIKKAAKGMLFYPSGSIGIVSMDDVTCVLLNLMESSIKNERFILVSENIKYKNLIERIAIELNSKKPIFELSKPLLYLLLILDKIASIIRLKKSFLNRATIESLSSQQSYDGSKIEREINFTYQNTDLILKKIIEDFKVNI